MYSVYDVTVPTFTRLLEGLKNVLSKTDAYAKKQGMNEAGLLNDTLAPDMFAFKKQVQVACDHAKGAVARLTGKENPKMDDNEETFAQLIARIDKTLEFVQSVSESDFAGAEARKITVPRYPTSYMVGDEYVFQFVLPNFYFHVVTAYDIMRKNGAPLIKEDFANGFPLRDL